MDVCFTVSLSALGMVELGQLSKAAPARGF